MNDSVKDAKIRKFLTFALRMFPAGELFEQEKAAEEYERKLQERIAEAEKRHGVGSVEAGDLETLSRSHLLEQLKRYLRPDDFAGEFDGYDEERLEKSAAFYRKSMEEHKERVIECMEDMAACEYDEDDIDYNLMLISQQLGMYIDDLDKLDKINYALEG